MVKGGQLPSYCTSSAYACFHLIFESMFVTLISIYCDSAFKSLTLVGKYMLETITVGNRMFLVM